jgi:hypothetical protein
VGDGKPFVAAVLVLDKNRWQQLARKLALPANDPNLKSVGRIEAAREKARTARTLRTS